MKETRHEERARVADRLLWIRRTCAVALCVCQDQAPGLAPGHGGRLMENDASKCSLYHCPFHVFPPSQTPPKTTL